VIFVVACLVAGFLYYLQVPRAAVVRATSDIPPMTRITTDMVELVKVAPVDVSTNAAQSTDQVVGQYASMTILAGQ
jgi:flagella basal body P-ring formation protein FlgA